MENAEQIQQLARAFQGSRILLTAFELGIFTVLESSNMESTKVAQQLDTEARATDRLLNALCGLGLVVKKGGRFSNSDAASNFLVEGKEGYLANLGHSNNLWDTWSSLTSAIIGDDAKAAKVQQQKKDQWYESFIKAMHTRARMAAPAIVSQLDLVGVNRVLDVGGGSGAFSIQFVKQGSDLKATVLDLPQVIEMTKRYVLEAGVADSFDYLAGDYTELESFGSNYDLVFLCAIIHINSPETNQKLIQKCAAALNPGGRLVINDFVMDDDRTSPVFGALFALNMLVGTREGDTYTESEIRNWFEAVGMTGFRRLEPVGPGTSLVGIKG